MNNPPPKTYSYTGPLHDCQRVLKSLDAMMADEARAKGSHRVEITTTITKLSGASLHVLMATFEILEADEPIRAIIENAPQ